MAAVSEQGRAVGIWELSPLLFVQSVIVNDHPACEDALGFKPYVEAVAEFLSNQATTPPLTLSVEGAWGSGKTSFMIQLEQELRRRTEDCRTFRFSAWQHNSEDALWAAFALGLIGSLSKSSSLWMRIWASLGLFFDRFSWRDGWYDMLRAVSLVFFSAFLILLIPLLGSYAVRRLVAVVAKSWQGVTIGGSIGVSCAFVFWLLARVGSIIGRARAIDLSQYTRSFDYRGRLALVERFREDLKKIVGRYAKKQRVYVFIDDLDRCDLLRAADLMQALNLMISDDTRIDFIIGMDRTKIAACLAMKHEKLIPYLVPAVAAESSDSGIRVGLEYGFRFIEKFVQLPFRLPQPVATHIDAFVETICKTSSASQESRSRIARILSWLQTNILRKGDDSRAEAKAPISSVAVPDSQLDEIVTARAEVKRAVMEDHRTIGDVVKIVAGCLDCNPRNLKQFVSLFRLRVFIASSIGLFDRMQDFESNALTLEQLGKFVAISLRWPQLLAELESDDLLLRLLQEIALDPTSFHDLAGPAGSRRYEVLVYWGKQGKLMDLLRTGCLGEDGKVDPEQERIFSLARLDVARLLETSPVTSASAEYEIAKGKEEAALGRDDGQ